MRGCRRKSGLLAIGLVLCLGLPATATVVLQLEIEDLVPMAPVVLVGEVNRVEASWNADQTKIYTRAWISPEEVLKGEKALGTVVVKTIGGTVGDVHAELPGAPDFTPGERVLVFLEPRQDGEGYLTIGFYQGKFKVFVDHKSGEEMLLRDAPERGVRVVSKKANLYDSRVRTLDEVRALIAGGGR